MTRPCDNEVAPLSTPPGSLIPARDLEWEVTHKKSKVHKGRGSSPEAALRDLRDGLALGVQSAQEEIDREQKRLDNLNALLADTEPGALPVEHDCAIEGCEDVRRFEQEGST